MHIKRKEEVTVPSREGLQIIALAALVATSLLVIFAGAAWGMRLLASHTQTQSQSTNPSSYALGGFPMPGNIAPDFTLSDQFGHSFTLSSLRGQEVVLAFIDSRCKTLCPLTSTIMYNARSQLATSSANKVQLLAVNANPTATSITTVQSWSIDHGMLHQWKFLTGSAQQLQSIYKQYNVFVQVDPNGVLEHDPIIFIIDAQGHERLYFETLDSNNQLDLKSQELGLEAGMKQWLPQSS